MAKVLFVNPVIREEDDPRHVPYGMALLAALAMREGHLVQVYDANAWRASDAVLVQILKAAGIPRVDVSPGMVELPAMVALEGRPQRRVVPTPKVTPGGITDDPDELRGADDVGEHDRSVDARPDRRDRLG